MDSNQAGAHRSDITIAKGVPLNQKFSYSMTTLANGQVQISAAGQSQTVQLPPSLQNANMYFKAGVYNAASGNDTSAGAATFYGLNME